MKNEFDDVQTVMKNTTTVLEALERRETLLVQIAGQVAGGIVSKRATLSYSEDDKFVRDLAHASVSIARAILDEVGIAP